METLYRWSKFVEADLLEEWESTLFSEEIPFVVEKNVKHQRWTVSVYCSTSAEAEQLRDRFGGSVNEIAPDAWTPGRSPVVSPPLRIRNTLLVTAQEDEDAIAQLQSEYPERIVLSFPYQLAFGTGEHPTTAGCLRFLSDFARSRGSRPWRMLDLGCGSGILAIAAAKLGASSVLALDNDAMALEYARENGKRHGVDQQVQFIEGDAVTLAASTPEQAYDLVAANLFSDLLIEIFPNLPQQLDDEGELIISGFLKSQEEAITESAKTAGLPLLDFSRRGKWVAARAKHQ